MIDKNKLAEMRARAQAFKQVYDGGTPLGVDVMRYIDRLTLAARAIVADVNELIEAHQEAEDSVAFAAAIISGDASTPPADAGHPEPRKAPDSGSDEEGLIAAIGYAPVKLSIRDHPEITHEYRTIDDRDGLIERILAAGFTRPEFVNTVEEIAALPEGSVLIGQYRAWHKATDPEADDDYPYRSTDGTGLYQAKSFLLYESFPLRVIRP